MKQVVKILSIFCVLIMPFFAHADDFNRVTSLISKRLSYMEKVARYKMQENQPIQDLVQEKKVLENSLALSKSLGIDSNSIKRFMITQINVAKSIQHRFFADWLSKPDLKTSNIPLKEIRSDISNINNNIIAEIANYLKSNKKIDESLKKDFFKAVQEKNLNEVDKEVLFSSLTEIKLNK
ncbi:Periplasmic chorismate mutase I precursor [Liberibacter crescens BT-1]|uniref:chorismate mutase n=1 Tax=Liberibacter crescens (strain BT-1) TaxID=1215343 RepID=L0ERC1_LIBCB|nr:gamma subclass chorismate mutase AroQ [Liberibacter crescens]AGA64009.1 Periplasmic chorismate mutase I precursor [Liberibacter crescens BT-1]AMC12319.1 hypothetical protein RL73_00265 [Liberibacter crescens]